MISFLKGVYSILYKCFTQNCIFECLKLCQKHTILHKHEGVYSIAIIHPHGHSLIPNLILTWQISWMLPLERFTVKWSASVISANVIGVWRNKACMQLCIEKYVGTLCFGWDFLLLAMIVGLCDYVFSKLIFYI